MAVREFLHDDRATRPAILTVVVGAHLAAFFIPLVERLEPVHDWPRLGVLFLISQPPSWLWRLPIGNNPARTRLPTPLTKSLGH